MKAESEMQETSKWNAYGHNQKAKKYKNKKEKKNKKKQNYNKPIELYLTKNKRNLSSLLLAQQADTWNRDTTKKDISYARRMRPNEGRKHGIISFSPHAPSRWIVLKTSRCNPPDERVQNTELDANHKKLELLEHMNPLGRETEEKLRIFCRD